MCGISVARGTPATSAASAGASVRMSLTTTCGRISPNSGSSARAASAAWPPSGESGSGGGNIRYYSAAADPTPAPSTAARRSSQVSIVTSCPRPDSARPRAMAGKTCPGSPKAATRNRMSSLRRVQALAGSGEDDLRHVAVGRRVQQETHCLADVLRPDHLLAGDLPLGELGHRGVDEAWGQCRALDAGAADFAVRRLGEVDHGTLGCGVDGKPGLSALAGDRGGVDDQRLAVLAAGLAQHRQALAGADDQRPQVDRQLHVEIFGLDLLHRRADPHAGVVDERVEST